MLTFSENYFRTLLEESRAECLKYNVPCRDTILQCLAQCAGPFAQRDAEAAHVQQLERQHAPSAEIEAAKKAYEQYKATATQCLTDTVLSLIPYLENDIRLDLESQDLHIHLMKCAIISQQGPANMAAFCETYGSIYAEELLAQVDVMEDMLVGGGAKNGKYLEAYKLYSELLALVVADGQPQFYECHRRLAMGVALELVVPIAVFDTTDVFINPNERFLHYVNAHKRGELDPHFPYFSPWEYRYVVNSDAEDEELQWGRDHLLRYHPEMVFSRIPKFTYCKEVKTDVGFRTLNWGEGRRTYRKLLSGGGHCGPRAWMGRFICKSFGLPTFGCRQPGHAAMIRYTPEQGWMPCLGGGIEVSWWEDRDGMDFKYEAHARLYEKDLNVYFQKVSLLECMATAYSEPPVRRDCQFQGPQMFWNALVRARRQDWARCASGKKGLYRRGPMNGEPQESCAISTYLARKDQPMSDNHIEVDATSIRIPACALTSKQSISCNRCFTGGGQIHFDPGTPSSVGYKIPPDATQQRYDITLKICTVHQDHEHEILYVTVNGSEVAQIPSRYTVGEWWDTSSVQIDIAPNDDIQIIRRRGDVEIWGISMRELNLKIASKSG